MNPGYQHHVLVPSNTFASAPSGPEKNPKSSLMEFFQKRQGAPTFETAALTKPPADPSFRCVLTCPAVQCPMGPEKVIPETMFEGIGRNKKLAEQGAAGAALDLYRSKNLIGNFRMMSPTAVGMGQQPVERKMYVPASSPTRMSTVYVQSPTPVPMVNPGSIQMSLSPAGESYVQQMPNGMPLHHPHPSPQPPYVTVTDTPQYAPVQPEVGLSNGGTYAVPDDDDEVEYTLNNSDIEEKRHEFNTCRDLDRLREMALDCLEEIMQLRQELFDAQKLLDRKDRLASQILKASNYTC